MDYIQLSNQVVNGEFDALKAYIELKKAEKEIEEAINIVQDLAISEADKYAGKTFKAFGATIEKKNGTSRWDYKEVNAWVSAKNRLIYVEKIAQAGGGADPESGELIDKAIKIDGKSTISIRLDKK